MAEQPKYVVPKNVAQPEVGSSREDRIREAVGLSKGPLPPVERGWLSRYCRHLTVSLSFPFTAQYVGGAGNSPPIAVTVISLLDPSTNPDDERGGLICAACHQEQQQQVPLVDIEVEMDHPNYQFLDDYWYWFWNWRFDPRI